MKRWIHYGAACFVMAGAQALIEYVLCSVRGGGGFVSCEAGGLVELLVLWSIYLAACLMLDGLSRGLTMVFARLPLLQPSTVIVLVALWAVAAVARDTPRWF